MMDEFADDGYEYGYGNGSRIGRKRWLVYTGMRRICSTLGFYMGVRIATIKNATQPLLIDHWCRSKYQKKKLFINLGF
ncbi:hypothetical protein EYC80_001259 [Monilinia laxa]|uniref:Uncharacterized protein n=1 Tax=Monilinia laxa TaxID=61186 RepID=A0A5N6K8Q8_MONLA|nr:hypothetical protein EYC80_001259 [Monilinia laxa]